MQDNDQTSPRRSAGINQPDISDTFVNSARLVAYISEAAKIKEFLFKEKVILSQEQIKATDLADLNNLSFKQDGRHPTLAEWREIDEKYAALVSCLDAPLRRKFRVRELSFFFGRLPLSLLVTCSLVTIIYFSYDKLIKPNTFAGTFIFLVLTVVWTISQGALGACASLGTSVMSTRTVEVTSAKGSEGKPSAASDEIDVTDLNILRIRIVIGSLFAFLIGLPFSSRALNVILKLMFEQAPEGQATAIDLKELSIVLIPFLVGFSTSFVLAVLNRVIASLQILLGMTSRIQ